MVSWALSDPMINLRSNAYLLGCAAAIICQPVLLYVETGCARLEERVNALTLARAVALGSVLAGAHDRRDPLLRRRSTAKG
jgi:hypothetical protein